MASIHQAIDPFRALPRVTGSICLEAVLSYFQPIEHVALIVRRRSESKEWVLRYRTLLILARAELKARRIVKSAREETEKPSTDPEIRYYPVEVFNPRKLACGPTALPEPKPKFFYGGYTPPPQLVPEYYGSIPRLKPLDSLTIFSPPPSMIKMGVSKITDVEEFKVDMSLAELKEGILDRIYTANTLCMLMIQMHRNEIDSSQSDNAEKREAAEEREAIGIYILSKIVEIQSLLGCQTLEDVSFTESHCFSQIAKFRDF